MTSVGTRELDRPAHLSWAVDLVVAVVLVAVFWVPSLLTTSDGAALAVGVAAAALVGIATPLRWRLVRTVPVIVLIATAAGWLLQVSTDPMLAVAWCLYPLALRRGSRTPIAGLIVTGVLGTCAFFLAVTSDDGAPAQRLVLAIAAIGATWLFGHVEARRMATVERAVQRQAAFEHLLQQASTARDVHDGVGHALSVIRAEADIAGTLPTTTEAELRESLASIERRARGALEDLQVLVRTLRTRDTAVAPAPSLTELLASARAAGLTVRSDIEVPELPTGTAAVMSRVVQEALSNVIRHSGAVNCAITIDSEGESFTVRIDDDGTGLPAQRRAGTGLVGMRERVEDAGGSLTVSNRSEGGTRVVARLPVGTAS